MSKTVFDTWQGDQPTPDGGTFLERALERALGNLDGDATLSAAERQAAKTALAAALSAEIRNVLAASRSRAPAPVSPGKAALLGFPQRRGAQKPGYFREPSHAIGVIESARGEETGREVRLTGGAATWLRVMPRHDPGREWTGAALKAAMRKGRAKSGQACVLPIFAGAKGMGGLVAADGYGIYAASPSQTESSGVVFAFRSGEVWSVDTYVQDALSEQQPNRAIMAFEAQLTAAFEAYVRLLERMGAPKPYRWIIGMDGLMGRSIELPAGEMAGLRGDCLLNTVEVAGDYDGAEGFEAAIAPFFQALYQACSTPVG